MNFAKFSKQIYVKNEKRRILAKMNVSNVNATHFQWKFFTIKQWHFSYDLLSWEAEKSLTAQLYTLQTSRIGCRAHSEEQKNYLLKAFYSWFTVRKPNGVFVVSEFRFVALTERRKTCIIITKLVSNSRPTNYDY